MAEFVVPPDFDCEFYKAEAGLKELNQEESFAHYQAEGKIKGLSGSPVASRNAFINWCRDFVIRRNGTILELGPGSAPAFTNMNVHYFDVFDRQGLIRRANTYREPVDNIPPLIHYHSPSGDMSIIDREYDLVFSSHNIEHQVDLIGHFKHIARCLAPGGIFACIVPDRRFTFDYFRPETTFMDVVGQHIDREGAGRHPLRALLEHCYLTTHNNARTHWQGDHGMPAKKLEVSKSQIQAYKKSPAYTDVHRWVFSEESFRDLCTTLDQVGMLPLELKRVYNVSYGKNEFNCLFTAKNTQISDK